MQFVFDRFCKDEILKIEDENYNYIIKARRHKMEDLIAFRNLEDNFIYFYKIVDIGKKIATLQLMSKEEKIVENGKKLHIAWSIVDPKIVYENISYLNELGIERISFLYGDYSQKNFKLNFEKIEKILINSSSQCGRSSIIKIDSYKSIDEFLKLFPDTYILDFSDSLIDERKDSINRILIGAEGGFSKRERELFDINFIVGFKSNLILKSQTAVISASAKIVI